MIYSLTMDTEQIDFAKSYVQSRLHFRARDQLFPVYFHLNSLPLFITPDVDPLTSLHIRSHDILTFFTISVRVEVTHGHVDSWSVEAV